MIEAKIIDIKTVGVGYAPRRRFTCYIKGRRRVLFEPLFQSLPNDLSVGETVRVELSGLLISKLERES